MRIFYASGKRPNGALLDSEVWHENLYGALVDLGHDVVEFDYDLEPLIAAADITVPANTAYIDEHRPDAEATLLRQVSQAHAERSIDLFFSYFTTSCATAATIGEIKRMGIPTMNWYCNASYQLHLVADIASAYDYCLVPELFRIDDYRALGANPVYCQEAANPRVYHPYGVPREFDAAFVGARYADRPLHISRLLHAGVDVHAFGPGWTEPGGVRLVESPVDLVRAMFDRRALRSAASRVYRSVVGYPEGCSSPIKLPRSAVGAPLSDVEMVKMYSRSKISLGFSGVAGTLPDGRRITQVRLRDFEAPMSGGFYMVEAMDELAEFYEIGKEIVCYEGLDDMIEKCKYYLVHDAQREEIRLAGHERALRDHTWQKRFQTVFEEVGLT